MGSDEKYNYGIPFDDPVVSTERIHGVKFHIGGKVLDLKDREMLPLTVVGCDMKEPLGLFVKGEDPERGPWLLPAVDAQPLGDADARKLRDSDVIFETNPSSNEAATRAVLDDNTRLVEAFPVGAKVTTTTESFQDCRWTVLGYDISKSGRPFVKILPDSEHWLDCPPWTVLPRQLTLVEPAPSEQDRDIRMFRVGDEVVSSCLDEGAQQWGPWVVVGVDASNAGIVYLRNDDDEAGETVFPEDCENIRLASEIEQARLAAEDAVEEFAKKLHGVYAEKFGMKDMRSTEWTKISEEGREGWRSVADAAILNRPRLDAMTLGELIRESGEIAKSKGWRRPDFDPDNDIPRWLCLIHSEVSEALEAHRRNEGIERFTEELADVLIRIADVAYQMDLPLEQQVRLKHAKNKNREYKHGGKRY